MDMMNIVYAVVVLGALGGIFGLALALAGKIFFVKVDEREEAITGILPGANCGGCGFPGCAGCAAAIVGGTASVNACLPGGMEVALGQFLKGGMDCPGAGHDHDIPAALELVLVEAVDFTQSSADTVAYIGFTQLFADGNAHPIGAGAVASGIEYQTAVCLSARLVKTLEYVIEF